MPNRTQIHSEISHVTLAQRLPAVSVDDLAMMLEIDLLAFGDKKGFRRRLQKALNDAYSQGLTSH